MVGASFTEFRGSGFWCRDPILELWLYLLACEIDKMEEAPQWLREAREDWREQAMAGYSECVSACLYKYADLSDHVEMVIKLSEQIMARLETQGPLLSSTLLSTFKLGGVRSYWTEDVPTETVVRLGRAFVSLLKGDIWWEPNTMFGMEVVVPDKLLDRVHDRDSFIAFVCALAHERRLAAVEEEQNPERYIVDGARNWKNADISSFLAAALVYFEEKPLHKPEAEPSWRMFAEFLWCGKIIE